MPYVQTYYSNAYLAGDADGIVVPAACDATNVDFELIGGWTVSGTITDTGALPLADIDLDVYTTNGILTGIDARTAADGTYTLGAFRPDSYIVCADPTPAQGYERRYYVDSGTLAGAVPVVVAFADVTGIDFALGLNLPPVAAILPFGGISNGIFVLDGSASSDPNGDELTFAWSQLAGTTVGIDDAAAVAPTFTLPGTNELLTIQLIASDFALSSQPLLVHLAHGPPIITHIGDVSNEVAVTWTLGAPPQPYTLEMNTNLTTECWTNVYTGSQVTHSLPPDGRPTLYFRVSATNTW
jgi:hypothetical protein